MNVERGVCKMKFSWYPGHMKVTLDKLAEERKASSVVLVILDARCPEASRNPSLEKIFKGKKIIYVLNKSDLAEEDVTGKWVKYFRKMGYTSVFVSCKTCEGREKLIFTLKNIQQKRKKGGIFRIVVVGIPNTGKSSVINMLSQKNSAKVGKKPGLTRGKQWLKISHNIEILDSPGVMIPRLEGDSPWMLGAIGAIKQEVMPVEEVAEKLVEYVVNKGIWLDGIDNMYNKKPLDIIEEIGKRRGLLKKGGIVDLEKASIFVLKMFREGKMGRISLQTP